MPRLEEIHANLVDRLQEAKEQGWLGEVAAIETTLAAANTETDRDAFVGGRKERYASGDARFPLHSPDCRAHRPHRGTHAARAPAD